MQCIITEKPYNQINTHYDETKKMAYHSQIVRAEESLRLSLDGPNLLQASDTNPPMIILGQDLH